MVLKPKHSKESIYKTTWSITKCQSLSRVKGLSAQRKVGRFRALKLMQVEQGHPSGREAQHKVLGSE